MKPETPEIELPVMPEGWGTTNEMVYDEATDAFFACVTLPQTDYEAMRAKITTLTAEVEELRARVAKYESESEHLNLDASI